MKQAFQLLSTLAVAILATALPVGADQIPPVPLGTKAPAFVTRTIDGKRLSLKSLRGHVVVLDFWATWCGPCRMATPTLVHLDRKFAKDGIKIVGMSLDEEDTRDQIPLYKKTYHVGYTLTYSPAANIKTAMAYHTNFDPDSGETFDHPIPPSLFVIDKKGKMRWGQIGYSLDEEVVLSKLINKLVRE